MCSQPVRRRGQEGTWEHSICRAFHFGTRPDLLSLSALALKTSPPTCTCAAMGRSAKFSKKVCRTVNLRRNALSDAVYLDQETNHRLYAARLEDGGFAACTCGAEEESWLEGEGEGFCEAQGRIGGPCPWWSGLRRAVDGQQTKSAGRGSEVAQGRRLSTGCAASPSFSSRGIPLV